MRGVRSQKIKHFERCQNPPKINVCYQIKNQVIIKPIIQSIIEKRVRNSIFKRALGPALGPSLKAVPKGQAQRM